MQAVNTKQLLFELAILAVAVPVIGGFVVAVAYGQMHQRGLVRNFREFLRLCLPDPRWTVAFGLLYGGLTWASGNVLARQTLFVVFCFIALAAVGYTAHLGYEWNDAEGPKAKTQRHVAAPLVTPAGLWLAVALFVEWITQPHLGVFK
jgi:hypothetical protein